ncbi:MAG: hypothetical protein D6722_26440 [Bacteroidetes bacterium]|nr:MAG: hypothetical protein D6722_26440 [Bacteroidota bacterium]
MRKDLAWVVDSAWLHPDERMKPEMLGYILTEKTYAVDLAGEMLAQVERALPQIADSALAQCLYHTFRRSVIFARERRGAAQAVYGYRLWSRGPAYRTAGLRDTIHAGLAEAAARLDSIDRYPVHTPLGQWRWQRDREAFLVYQQAITETGWEEVGLGGVVVK